MSRGKVGKADVLFTCNNDFGLQAQAHVNKTLFENKRYPCCGDITFNSGTDMTRAMIMDMNYIWSNKDVKNIQLLKNIAV